MTATTKTTVFINNTSDFRSAVICELEMSRGWKPVIAARFFDKHFQIDGGVYGERTRFHFDSEHLPLVKSAWQDPLEIA